jgi:hypothetical protein
VDAALTSRYFVKPDFVMFPPSHGRCDGFSG